MTSPAFAVATYIDSNSATLTAGTNLFVGRLQETPDLCVAVADYSSQAPEFTMGSSSLDHADLEVVVRCTRNDYATGEDLAQTLRTLLNAITPGTYSGLAILRVAPVDAVTALPPDKNDRPIFSARFSAVIQRG